jgi:hypothetical protein
MTLTLLGDFKDECKIKSLTAGHSRSPVS